MKKLIKNRWFQFRIALLVAGLFTLLVCGQAIIDAGYPEAVWVFVIFNLGIAFSVGFSYLTIKRDSTTEDVK